MGEIVALKYQQRLDLEEALDALEHSKNVSDNSRAYFYLVEAISILHKIKRAVDAKRQEKKEG